MSRSPSIAVALVSTVTCVALLSAAHGVRPTWNAVDAGYDMYSGYSASSRADAPVNGAGFIGDMFDTFDSFLRPGDRVYFQIPRTPYGTYDLHDTVAALGNFFFLPATQVGSLGEATVVVSYEANPAALHRTFLMQVDDPPGTLSRLSLP